MTEHEQSLRALAQREISMRDNGLVLAEVGEDTVTVTAEVQPRWRNTLGMVHGGFLMMMADNTAGLTAHTDGRRYVTQNTGFQFLSNVNSGTIRATGVVLRRGRTVASVQVNVTAEDGTLLATGLFSMFAVQPKDAP